MKQNVTSPLTSVYLVIIVSLLIMPLGFLIRLLYSHSISIAEFGFFYAVINFFQIFSFFINLGLTGTLPYFIPKLLVNKDFRKIRTVFFYVVGTQLLLYVLVSLGIYFSADFLLVKYFDSEFSSLYIKLFLLYLLGILLLNILKRIYASHQMAHIGKLVSFSQLFLILVFSFGIFLFFENNLLYYFSLVWSVLMFLVSFIFMGYFLYLFPYYLGWPSIDIVTFKEVFSYAFYLVPTGLNGLILNKIDIFLITLFIGTNAVGAYGNSFSLVMVLASLVTSPNTVFTPLFSSYTESNKTHILREILSTLYELLLFFMMPVLLVFAFFSQQILGFIFGDGYTNGWIVLLIFSLFSVFRVFYTYNLSFLNGMGYAKSTMKIMLPVALFNLIGSLLLINILGMEGVALITVISWFLIFSTTYVVLQRALSFTISYMKILKTFFTLGIFALLVFTIKQLTLFNIFIIDASLTLLVSGAVYVILGYVLNIFRLGDLYIFIPEGKIKEKIKSYQIRYLPFLT